MATSDKMVQIEVAPGRSLFTPGTPVKVTENGKDIYQYTEGKLHGPGSKVMVTVADAAMFRKQGHACDPTATVIPTGDGPSFYPDDGPIVQPA